MDSSPSKQRNRSQAVGLLLAGAVIPKTFQKSLIDRSTLDQGMITGITIALVYMMGTIFQDATELTAEALLQTDRIEIGDEGGISFNNSAVIGMFALAAGILLEKKNTYDPSEKLTRSALRTSGYWLRFIGIAGATIGAIEGINNTVSSDKKSADDRNLLPYVIGAGILFSLLDEVLHIQGDKVVSVKQNLLAQKPLRVVGIGGAVAVLLAALAYGERAMAGIVDRTVAKNAPYFKRTWLPIGHVLTAGGMLLGIYKFIENTYHKIENNAENVETGFSRAPLSLLSSGGPKSFVKWPTLAIQGRRHIGSKLSAEQIQTVMGESAIEPIRVFVGLDSAPSEEERVAITLHELERTNAYNREVIVVVSPTGTGYINYVMSESIEYMTRGSSASVAIQYSKRPSPMSLDRVDEGFRQYRMLLNGIKRKIDGLPENDRPRLLLFGESLGAWTSQNAFLHEGTDGLQYIGVDSALWIGTPAGSKWKDQVLSDNSLNSSRELVGMFDSYDDIRTLTLSQQRSLRYVMLTHHNDPITQFGMDLLIKQPTWIDDPNKRPKEMKNKIRYRTPTLFVQMLFGMKNALKPVPGDFVAHGHDYRKDLAQFIKFTYRFDVSRKQLANIEKQLRLNELVRQSKIEMGISEDAR